jgi:NADH:ubiquinone oxidoreductase subunit E
MTMSTESAVRSDLESRLLPIADRYRGRKGITIPLLADLQGEMGYIAPEAVDFFARELEIGRASCRERV